MAGVCDKELNAQLQMMSARIKQLEDGLSTSFIMQILTFVKHVAALFAGGATEMAAAALVADPLAIQILQLAAQQLSSIGEVDTSGITMLYEMMSAAGAEEYKKLMLQLALGQIDVPPYSSDFTSSVSDKIQEDITNANLELQTLLLHGGAPAAVQAARDKLAKLNAAAGNFAGAIGATNDIAACKIASSVIGLK